MPTPVFNYAEDIRKVVFVPELRAGFYRLEPGQQSDYHSHDLGHEVFLVLDGVAEFDVEGDTIRLEAGQLIIVFAEERHAVRCVGDQPMTLFLSVTPHWEPSHTFWDSSEKQSPAVWGQSNSRERDAEPETASIEELANLMRETSTRLKTAAEANQAAFSTTLSSLLDAHRSGDDATVLAALQELSDQSDQVYRATRTYGEAWNRFAPDVARAYDRDRTARKR